MFVVNFKVVDSASASCCVYGAGDTLFLVVFSFDRQFRKVVCVHFFIKDSCFFTSFGAFVLCMDHKVRRWKECVFNRSFVHSSL